jgi:isocitrate dehydrogenase
MDILIYRGYLKLGPYPSLQAQSLFPIVHSRTSNRKPHNGTFESGDPMKNGTIERFVEPLRDRVSVDTVIPYIAGDGVGPEVCDAMRRVVDTLLERMYGGKIHFTWLPLLAGETAYARTGSLMPTETLEAIRAHRVAIKGPLATPTGGREQSLNALLRRHFNLYQCVRPVRPLPGVPSPVVASNKMDVVIVRDNMEDGRSEIDRAACKRLVRGAFLYAEQHNRRSVTLIFDNWHNPARKMTLNRKIQNDSLT